MAASLVQLSRQSFIRDGLEIVDIHVVSNGCTDNTAEVARSKERDFRDLRAGFYVHDLEQGGKSRSWNRAVHEFVSGSADITIFIDADIELVSDGVIAEMLASLRSDARLAACSGFPVKNISGKTKVGFLNHASLIVSEQSRRPGLINGSLYVARTKVLKEVWLPDQTPGEDGFLNAMLTTSGFTRPIDTTVVTTPGQPTHTFHAHGPLEFVSHERRMIVGTIINRWIFEHLWSLELTRPAGSLIRDWNERDPEWVERLVRQRAENSRWLIPRGIVFGRFANDNSKPWWKWLAYAPLATAATLATLPSAYLANKRLKEFGAATTW